MTIITHNAPKEGAASLRDNISHKYAKRLLSLLLAISKTCFVSVQGFSDSILKNISCQKSCRLIHAMPNEILQFLQKILANQRILHKDAQAE